jgi:membrane protein
VSEFLEDRCSQLAASVSFHVLFSIFPLVAVVGGAFGLAAGRGARDAVADAIASSIPLSSSGERQLRDLLHGATGGVSAVGFVGVVGLVWSASGMMAAIRAALDQAWDVQRRRPWLLGKLVDVALVAGVGVVALATLGLTIAVRLAGGGRAGAFRLGSGWVGLLLGVLVPLAVCFCLVLLLYRLVPATTVRVADAWAAALLVACCFVLAQNLFALYVEHFGHYNAIYGSVGAVVAFMLFVYVNVLAFLLGAEVASEWPRMELPARRG